LAEAKRMLLKKRGPRTLSWKVKIQMGKQHRNENSTARLKGNIEKLQRKQSQKEKLDEGKDKKV
jgi:hypothetical protein